MTTVLPGRDGSASVPEEVTAREAFVLDDVTKQLLRQLVLESRPGAGAGAERRVDWEAIFSLAEKGPSEELALGSAVLAAEEALAGDPLPAPSVLLASSRDHRPSPPPPRRGAPGPGHAVISELRTEPGRAELVVRQIPGGPGPSQPAVFGAGPARRPVGQGVQEVRALSELPKRVRRALSGATWVRNLGIIIVLFSAWQLWGTGIAEAHSQSDLQGQYEALVKDVASEAGAPPPGQGVATTAPVLARARAKRAGPVGASLQAKASLGANGALRAKTSLRAETRAFAEATLPGGVLGRIRIPAIGVSDYFVEGVGEDQLQEGPGRYPGSGLPGQDGNLAIAGHRTTYGAPFFRLGEVRPGDAVIIDTPEGRAIYKVSHSPFAVSPYDVDVLGDFGDARLTLTTCNPPFLATTRLIVVAKLTSWLPTGAPVPAAPAVAPSRAAGAASKASTGITTRASTASRRGAVRDSMTSSSRPTISEPARSQAALPPPKSSVEVLKSTAPKPSGAAAVSDKGVDDNATVGQAMADEGNGWHLARLPVVLAVVTALCALGALYERAVRFFIGASRWLVMAPLWAAGLLILFKVLGLTLPADL